MYNMDSDKYTCDYCNREYSWDGEEYGNIWECEKCGKHFCTDCFIRIAGSVAFEKMNRECEIVLCQDCYSKAKKAIDAIETICSICDEDKKNCQTCPAAAIHDRITYEYGFEG